MPIERAGLAAAYRKAYSSSRFNCQRIDIHMLRTIRLLRSLIAASVFAGLLIFVPDGIDDGADNPTVRLLLSLSRGTLVICGGGEMSDDVLDQFVEAAGGEAARVVVITTASGTADSDEI
jgi:hypothetical protein